MERLLGQDLALRVPTFLFHREALLLQLVSHLTDYLLHEKFQSGLRAGPSPEASVEFVIIYLL